MFKVMIVDDMEVLRKDVKRLSLWGEASGFIIEEEAKDGLDALRKLETKSFDLVITDIRMPNMDGIELLRNISEKNLCPFTVLLSDFTEYNFARQGFLYGAFDYIGKPVDENELAQLLTRIRRHLDEMHEERKKYRELQEIAEEALHRTEDVKQVVMHIGNGNPNAAAFTFDLIDMICDMHPDDMLKTQQMIKNTVREMIEEIRKKHPWLDLFTDAEIVMAADYSSFQNLNEMKIFIKAQLEELIAVIHRFSGCRSSDIVKGVCEYVLTHVNEEISVKLLSEKLFINKSYLSEVFKQKYGMTLLKYITMTKIERAKKLLREGNLKNYQIAEMLGFQDNEYFGKLFKKYTGVLPKDYRN